MQTLLILLAALSLSISYCIWVRGALKKGVTLERSTWAVWMIQDALILYNSLRIGISPSVILPTVWTCGASVLFYIAIKKGKKNRISLLDKLCLIIGLVSIPIGILTPRWALFTSLVVALVGGIPTTIKAWRQPWTDSATAWFLQLIGTSFIFLTIEQITFDSSFLTISVGIYQIIMIIPLLAYWAIDKSRVTILLKSPQEN